VGAAVPYVFQMSRTYVCTQELNNNLNCGLMQCAYTASLVAGALMGLAILSSGVITVVRHIGSYEYDPAAGAGVSQSYSNGLEGVYEKIQGGSLAANRSIIVDESELSKLMKHW